MEVFVALVVVADVALLALILCHLTRCGNPDVAGKRAKFVGDGASPWVRERGAATGEQSELPRGQRRLGEPASMFRFRRMTDRSWWGVKRGMPVLGVPKMFRWLTDQYPDLLQQSSKTMSSEGIDVDNLYLDMNGIIHPCSHSDGEVSTLTNRERARRVLVFTDKIIRLVKPRRMVYLAIDGVAPRAKMNQQRSRRFRSSLDREIMLQTMALENRKDVASLENSFDSNCITPGTQFMANLADVMREWIDHKVATDPLYSNGLRIIFSGADVPGEGEHKIMDYIRHAESRQGADSDWGPHLKHCFYGLDADLIMLSLVTHQPNFCLLREKMAVRMNRGRKKKKDCLEYKWFDFETLDIRALRQMLRLQFIPDSDDPADVERVVDDFVFLTIMVGNDFLPNIPHLHIRQGALNQMLDLYKRFLPRWGGYLTNKDEIDLARFEEYASAIASTEAAYFAKRGMLEKNEAYCMPSSYADEYRRQKFELSPTDPDEAQARRQVVADYIEGMRWVLHYYHKGVRNYTWFYPYMYSPLLTDFVGLSGLASQIASPRVDSPPVTPLTQLLSVLPPQSSALLPRPYARLMMDEESPIKSAYPTKFLVDPNGKTEEWEGIVLIPFIDQEAMARAIADGGVNEELTEKELARNRTGRVHEVQGKAAPQPRMQELKREGERLLQEVADRRKPGPDTPRAGDAPGEIAAAKKGQTRDSLSRLTVPALKGQLRDRGLSVTGRKDELIQRLMDAVGDVATF